MNPKNKKQSQQLWTASIAVSLFLAFCSAWLKQATTIPVDQDIAWRLIFIDVVTYIVAAAPVFGTGLLVPKYGQEEISLKIHQLGKEEALDRLSESNITQLNYDRIINNIDYNELTKLLLKKKAEEDAEQ